MTTVLTDFVERPNFGSEGRAIRVYTNFFKMTSLPEADIIHYDITITPSVPPALNRKVYKEFVELNRTGILCGIRPVFDGRKNVFAPRLLPLPPGETTSFDVTIHDDDATGAAAAANNRRLPRLFKVSIKKVGEININELYSYLGRRSRLTSNVLKAIMALDVLIRHQPSMNYSTVGRSIYTPKEAGPLFGGLEAWQGYYQSARPGQGQMYVNINLSATAFYESGSLIVTVAKILGRRDPDDLRRGVMDRDYHKLERFLKGLKIRVIHRGEATARRTFRIIGITLTPASDTMFVNETGQINVASYFATTYRRRLNYPHLPCVVVKRNIFFPIEVCEIVEGQRYTRKLNDKQNADMIRLTCVSPNIKANKIKNGYDVLNYRDNEYLQQFGIRVSNEMGAVPARILPTPTLQFNPSSKDPNVRPKEGVWNLKDKKVAVGSTLGSWSIVVFGSDRELPDQAIASFNREFVSTCQDSGMNIPNRTPPVIHANAQGDIEAILKQAWLRAGNAAKAQPQLILCVLPNTGIGLYAEIKRVCDTEIGVATQCIQSKNMLAPKKQYCANVCLKINVKLGGMNSFLNPAEIPFISERPTILMGADVTHPPPGSQNKPSIAALCASMDAKASRYAASIRVQHGREEIIADLTSMVKELLKLFYQTCGRKPERILFYRDGVSEGQFASVLTACQALDINYAPKITFIVVQKRHHARFFPTTNKESDHTDLQSHPGLQGTSRPTHYHVLYNENDLRADQCTRVVSLVPPVYYAHLVCSRARYHSRGKWTDTESSDEGIGSTFDAVRPELQKVN
ncbi:8916_t:CDS:10 [Entrophospora sp. SA101]|nr:10069_t:CDS:10 [Entrophospora sp. SA101]CAJ0904509.1 8916_t:CDS:10 [Entrophospora sp. SA101]